MSAIGTLPNENSTATLRTFPRGGTIRCSGLACIADAYPTCSSDDCSQECLILESWNGELEIYFRLALLLTLRGKAPRLEGLYGVTFVPGASAEELPACCGQYAHQSGAKQN